MIGMISWESIILLVSGAFGDISGAVSGQGDAEIGQVLLAVCGGVLGKGFSEVESALELAVVGIMILVADSHKVKIAASLVCIRR